jgi:predicted small lipoprotein YifL
MKKIAVLLAVVLILSAFAGCAKKDPFEIPGYSIEFDPGDGWSTVEDSGYDLQLTNGKAYITVMAYVSTDFIDPPDPLEIYRDQNDVEIISAREGIAVVEEETSYNHKSGKTITTTMYSAQYNGTENRYLSCMVQFNNEADSFVWFLFNSTADYMSKHRGSYIKLLEGLVCTAVPMEYGEEGEPIEGDYSEGEILEDDFVDETYEDDDFYDELDVELDEAGNIIESETTVPADTASEEQ